MQMYYENNLFIGFTGQFDNSSWDKSTRYTGKAFASENLGVKEIKEAKGSVLGDVLSYPLMYNGKLYFVDSYYYSTHKLVELTFD
jgi:hypothetical protein